MDSKNGHHLATIIARRKHALDAPELARLLGVSKDSVYRLAKQNRIPSIRVGTAVRFDPKAVARWLREQSVGS